MKESNFDLLYSYITEKSSSNHEYVSNDGTSLLKRDEITDIKTILI